METEWVNGGFGYRRNKESAIKEAKTIKLTEYREANRPEVDSSSVRLRLEKKYKI